MSLKSLLNKKGIVTNIQKKEMKLGERSCYSCPEEAAAKTASNSTRALVQCVAVSI